MRPRHVDPTVTATPGRPSRSSKTACRSSTATPTPARAGLTALNSRYRGHTIAIVGVGGTGSYILDQVAKTWVDRIILIDGDVFENHSAFRAPGAAAHKVLQAKRNKAEYFAEEYSRMHTGITAYPEFLTTHNLHLIEKATFVFLAAADARERPQIMAWLRERGIPFIDVGMSLREGETGLTGIAKVMAYLPGSDVALPTGSAVVPGEDDYSSNIQVADLNALDALLAIIRWKRHLGFYATYEMTSETVYKLHLNEIRNGDMP